MTEKDIMTYGRATIVRPPRRKVFVVGPQGASNYKFVRDTLNRLTFWFDDVVVFTRSDDYQTAGAGWKVGIGVLAERWGAEPYNHYLVHTYHTFPEVYGKEKAPEKRDELLLLDLMRVHKGVAVAFDDGEDPVVKYLIELCRYHEVRTKVIKYEEES